MAVEHWFGLQQMVPVSWTCGNCGLSVGGNRGFYRNDGGFSPPQMQGHPCKAPGGQVPTEFVTERFPRILICPACDRPTYFEKGKQVPGVAYGRPVQHLPADLDEIYTEARNCMSVGAFIPAVLTARTILMHIAVDSGAAEGLNFIAYVDYLVANGFVPPNSKPWVDHIRKKGNEATHRIALMTRDDAEKVLRFVEMIMIFKYEYPAMIPGTP